MYILEKIWQKKKTWKVHYTSILKKFNQLFNFFPQRKLQFQIASLVKSAQLQKNNTKPTW